MRRRNRRKTGRLIRMGLSFLLVVLICVGTASVDVFADMLRETESAEASSAVEGGVDGVPAEWDEGGVAVESVEPVEEDDPEVSSEAEPEVLQAEEPETFAADSDAIKEVNGYICFDLAAGSVTIGRDSYSGAVYVAGAKKTFSVNSRTGDEKFYIYQSTDGNKSETGYKDVTDFDATTGIGTNCRVPEYPRVQHKGESWTKFITNNTDVYAVSEAWEDAAREAGRTPLGKQKTSGNNDTGNYITFKGETGYKADVTIDNIWTYYQPHGAGRTQGGITAHLVKQKSIEITLRLKGDNRLGNIHYGANKGTNNQIIFVNGEEEGTPGSITVADFPNDFSKNYWCSAIGGDDSNCDRSDGIVIESGVIYAGTTPEDNCTAIGGGGNEYGRVTINDGTVTAVVSSTGTAIGGGIGYNSKGGDTDVIINDGEIYAYNLGIEKGKGNDFANFVPSAAIGGGGSKNSAGNLNATITINGGKIYAQSLGGAAIGGGSSATEKGGPAKININGGTIIAKSISGTWGNQEISAGASIGGGTGGTKSGATGGSVTLNISGENTILRTGSIGGGKTNSSNPKDKIGSATVTIRDGDIVGQVVMAGGSNDHCTFEMTGGTIHDTNVTEKSGIALKDVDTETYDPNPAATLQYIQSDGGAVWINDSNGEVKMNGGTIRNNKALNGGGMYVVGGNVTVVDGAINNNQATGNGGGICIVATKDTNPINVKMLSGSLNENIAGESGGAMAVETQKDATQKVFVEIGCLLDHKFKAESEEENAPLKPTLPIDYTDKYSQYANYCDKKSQHGSCPLVQGNTANLGGAIHIDCNTATLEIYCANISANVTNQRDDKGIAYDIEVDGGTVLMGDETYHNRAYNSDHPENGLDSPRGNIQIKCSNNSGILVKGGKLDIYGNTSNPSISAETRTKIPKDADPKTNYFMDHRLFTGEKIFVVQYRDIFKGDVEISYKYYDYEKQTEIFVEDVPTTTRQGYVFRGWCTQEEYDETNTDKKCVLYDKLDEEQKIDPQLFELLSEEAKIKLNCPHCQDFSIERLLILYSIWDKIYELKKDQEVLTALNEGWTIEYYDEKNNGPKTFDGDEPVKVYPRSKVTFTPKEGALPLTLAFDEIDDTGDQDRVVSTVVDSLERLAENGGTVEIGPKGHKFKVKVTEKNGVYTLTMPARDVTVSTVWGLYLDYGTIELFEDGFQQDDYWYGKDKTILWSGDYRILQCEDDNMGKNANHETYTGGEGTHEFHSTKNVLQLNDDLSGRKIFLGRLNIDNDKSIELAGGAKATLTQQGKLQVKNILVPETASLTLTGSYEGDSDSNKDITLVPTKDTAGIGSDAGLVTIENCEIYVKSTSKKAVAINGENVTLQDCKMGDVNKQLKALIKAKKMLNIKNCEIFQ